ncbi:pVII [Guinea pig adenovirus 1]|uniref:PVII n=1 Tax=Guinea pig adenovirus 1 TaxID=2847100 RepID=A0AC61M027_9ADEN|nr:pVII [Guinea pig adenovirus]QIZ64158.1 pVII [Guinea pig adenovirus 1]
MAILISPDNNTGWGLGMSRMYGGARFRSEGHPVRVRQHFRAPWGSLRASIERVVRRSSAPAVVTADVPAVAVTDAELGPPPARRRRLSVSSAPAAVALRTPAVIVRPRRRRRFTEPLREPYVLRRRAPRAAVVLNVAHGRARTRHRRQRRRQVRARLVNASRVRRRRAPAAVVTLPA